jgi:hypothetical protein
VKVQVRREQPEPPDLFRYGLFEYDVLIIAHGIAVCLITGTSPG